MSVSSGAKLGFDGGSFAYSGSLSGAGTAEFGSTPGIGDSTTTFSSGAINFGGTTTIDGGTVDFSGTTSHADTLGALTWCPMTPGQAAS